MQIESIENKKLRANGEVYDIIELRVRGDVAELEKFKHSINDIYSMAYDEWVEKLAMLVMTFDKVPKEQTLTMIKAYTKEWIKRANEMESKKR